MLHNASIGLVSTTCSFMGMEVYLAMILTA